MASKGKGSSTALIHRELRKKYIDLEESSIFGKLDGFILSFYIDPIEENGKGVKVGYDGNTLTEEVKSGFKISDIVDALNTQTKIQGWKTDGKIKIFRSISDPEKFEPKSITFDGGIVGEFEGKVEKI